MSQRCWRAWRRQFGPRLQAPRLVAQWAMRPALVAAAVPLLGSLPAVLTWGALCAGKAAALAGASVPSVPGS